MTHTLVIDTSYGSTVGLVGHEPIIETDSRTHVERLQVNISRACEQATDMICQAAGEAGMPIEYNLLGLQSGLRGHFRGYPSKPFWQYAKKYDNTVILGTDAHDPALLADTSLWETGRADVTGMGYRLTESLRMEE